MSPMSLFVQTVLVVLLSTYCEANPKGTKSKTLDVNSGLFKQNGMKISEVTETGNTQETFRPSAKFGDAPPTKGLRAEAAKPLHVYVLPHSHDDPGWVRTSDQYFEFFVRHIYSTAVKALSENPMRKFQAVESIYFRQWYETEATQEERELAYKFINNGQMQIAVGGWVMPDEATTDYTHLIQTMTLGHEWLFDTFGEAARPRFGFQVDPFGASMAFAALSAMMGFNGHLVARLNYYDKGWMQGNKQLEFLWQPSPDLARSRGGEHASIFTHIMDQYQYSTPGIPVDLQFKHLCAAGPNVSCPGGGFLWDGDDSNPAWYWTEQQKKQGYSVYPAVNASNVQFYSDFFVENCRQRSEWFRTPHLLWPFGTDFQHFNASEMMYSMDKIIDYVNARNGDGERYEGVTLEYGMLDDYYSALRTWTEKQAPQSASWRLKQKGDFLPYNTLNCAGASQDFDSPCSGNAGPQYNVSWPQTWSGFFTSHISLKISTRRHGELLRASEAMLAVAASTANFQANPSGKGPSASFKLRSAYGLLAHHDAQTGTMGPGCGNKEEGNGNGYTCPSLPMGTPGNRGAVAMDYQDRMVEGWKDLSATVESAATALLQTENVSLLAESEGIPTSDTATTYSIFNPLGWTLHRWLPLSLQPTAGTEPCFTAQSGGQEVLVDWLPGNPVACASAATGSCADALNTPSMSNLTLWVRVTVPPLGFQTITVSTCTAAERRATLSAHSEGAHSEETEGDAIVVKNNFYSYGFDTTTGLLTGITDHVGNVTLPTTQRLLEYTSFSAFENYTSGEGAGEQWDLGYTGARSGSYLLHTSEDKPMPISGAYAKPTLNVVRGVNKHITEVRQQFSDTASQVWRIFDDENPLAGAFAELQLGVGPVGGNKELVSLFETDINTEPEGFGEGSIFYSDNNGYLMVRRQFSSIKTFPDGEQQKVAPDNTYKLALNYHPMVREAFIKDDDAKLTLISAQSGAVTSRIEGQLEVMLMRRSLQDDSKGACQVFNDTSGQYANIPADYSEGSSCSNFGWAGTCRPDNCPTTCIPMNVSERVETSRLWVLAGEGSVNGEVSPSAHNADTLRHQLAQILNNPPLVFVSSASAQASVAPLGPGNELPQRVHLLTLRERGSTSSVDPLPERGAVPASDTLVLRLQNIDTSVDEEAPVAPPSTLTLEDIGFCNVFGSAAAVEEKSLSTIWPLSGDGALTRWSWPSYPESSYPAPPNLPPRTVCKDAVFSLGASDIRTFSVNRLGVSPTPSPQVDQTQLVWSVVGGSLAALALIGAAVMVLCCTQSDSIKDCCYECAHPATKREATYSSVSVDSYTQKSYKETDPLKTSATGAKGYHAAD